MSEVSKMRQIKPIKIPDLLPATYSDDLKPDFEWVDPQTLFVEEKYQRNLGERSITQIRKIFKDFEWSHFKPPVCSRGEGGKLFIIDGQHTAIAAATHPKIKKIPVMVVEAVTMKARATAFIGHNRDRLAMTPQQLYYSSVAAGDPIAMLVQKSLNDTGCAVVRYAPPVWVEGQTMAAGTLLNLAQKKGSDKLSRVLKILMDAKRAPVIASEIAAVADLIYGKEWQNKFNDYDLSTIIRKKSADQWRADAEAKVRKGMTMPMKRALAILWYTQVPKKHGPTKK